MLAFVAEVTVVLPIMTAGVTTFGTAKAITPFQLGQIALAGSIIRENFQKVYDILSFKLCHFL